MTQDAMPQNRVSYTKDDVKREAAEEVLTEGTYLWTPDDTKLFYRPTKHGKGPGNDLAISVKHTGLDPETQQRVNRVKAGQYMTLPLRDPDNPDTHEPPSWAKRVWWEYLSALNPSEFPAEPKKIKGVWQYQDEEIDPDTVDDLKEQGTDKIMEAAQQTWDTKGANLKGFMFYADAIRDGDFVNLKRCRPGLKDGEICIAREDMFSRNIKGTNGAAKPSKKTSKKTAAKKSGGRRRR